MSDLFFNETFLLKTLGIWGVKKELFVCINGVYVSPKDIQSHLGRYSHCLVHDNQDETYQFQHLGTSVGIQYRSRFYLISSSHQFKLAGSDRIGFIDRNNSEAVFPCAIGTLNTTIAKSDSDNSDFIIYEYRPSDYSLTNFTSHFIKVAKTSSATKKYDGALLAFGYPTSRQVVDYYNRQVDMKLTAFCFEHKGETKDSGIHEFELTNDKEDEYVEDGMSGAPIFEIYMANEGFTVKWRALIIRGGDNSKSARAISADRILTAIDSVL